MEFSNSLSDNMYHLNTKLDVDGNFDIVYRTFYIGEREACLYFIEGFTQSDLWQKILDSFSSIKADDIPQDAHEFSKRYLPYGQVGLVKDDETMVKQLLTGISCLFINGYNKCLTVDCRSYPSRGVSEPEKDKVLRGSRDGFVEPWYLILPSSAAGSVIQSLPLKS